MPDQLKLVLCGSGLRAGELTAAAREALEGCARIHLLCMPSELASGLRAQFPRAEDLGPLQRTASEAVVLRRLEASLRKPGRVGVVVAGHPLIFSPAPKLLAICRRANWASEILPGVGTFDGVLAAMGSRLPGSSREVFSSGMVVCGADDWLRGAVPLHRRFSTMVLNVSRDSFARTQKALVKAYGARWPAFLVRVGGPSGDQVETLTVGALSGKLGRLDGQTLFVPGKPK